MNLSIVIPIYNEAGNILPLLTEIQAVLSADDGYEIIYVDDGSHDGTLDILTAALPSTPALRVLRHGRTCGQSAAIHTGVKAARYPWVATLDGDGQNDPADLPRLCCLFAEKRQANDNLWMLVGWRRHRHDPWWRRFSSIIANVVRAGLLGDHTPDTGCGLKIFLRDKFLALPYFDHMHRFLPALVIRAGGETLSVAVNHRPRTQGQSKYGTLDRLAAGIIDLLGVIWLIKRSKLTEVYEVGHE